jgi:hypothetical protein
MLILILSAIGFVVLLSGISVVACMLSSGISQVEDTDYFEIPLPESVEAPVMAAPRLA